MPRKFEKISYQQFCKDIKEDEILYNKYSLPKRASQKSAGYDFFAIENFDIQPGEIRKIPTGYKAEFNDNEVLMLFVRSSMGFKYNVRMCNQVGIIDSDYYNNPKNEGHIFIALQNEGTKNFEVKKGEAFAQGIFTTFLTIEEEEIIENKRTGGLGSTTKRRDNNE